MRRLTAERFALSNDAASTCLQAPQCQRSSAPSSLNAQEDHMCDLRHCWLCEHKPCVVHCFSKGLSTIIVFIVIAIAIATGFLPFLLGSSAFEPDHDLRIGPPQHGMTHSLPFSSSSFFKTETVKTMSFQLPNQISRA
ncbi:hypothetical protein FB639_001033 [Coemansia asiatica]|nr:hypothetical protein FB639_001033 [Coemansia asiatica]